MKETYSYEQLILNNEENRIAKIPYEYIIFNTPTRQEKLRALSEFMMSNDLL